MPVSNGSGHLVSTKMLRLVGALESEIAAADLSHLTLQTTPRVLTFSSVPKNGPLKFDVGIYNDIKGVPGLDAHHVGQKAVMKSFIPDYTPGDAPSILVPKVGHTIRGPKGIVSRSTKGFSSVRDVIARDVKELRRVYPEIPNSQLKNLIDLNRTKYPAVKK